MAQNYVIGVVLNESLTQAICLNKRKGPSDLIGKWTFPGGKIESEEELVATEGSTPSSYFSAMSREFKEETGVDIPEDGWVSFGYKSFEDGSRLYLFGAVKHQKVIESARTLEEEEVRVLNVDANKDLNLKYVPDFDQLVGIVKNYFDARRCAYTGF
jgi:8-oxo-dGTP pyrophosphatase MutT (NUDIX family)